MRAVIYTIDPRPGLHRRVFVEGVGKCRAHFAQLINQLEEGNADIVVVAGLNVLFAGTSRMWMEKFIATVKRRGVLVADAITTKEYDLNALEDERAFRERR